MWWAGCYTTSSHIGDHVYICMRHIVDRWLLLYCTVLTDWLSVSRLLLYVYVVCNTTTSTVLLVTRRRWHRHCGGGGSSHHHKYLCLYMACGSVYSEWVGERVSECVQSAKLYHFATNDHNHTALTRSHINYTSTCIQTYTLIYILFAVTHPLLSGKCSLGVSLSLAVW